MKRMLFLLGGVCLSLQAAAGAERVLWPSDEGLLKAQTDSQLAWTPTGTALVRTGVKYAWPGVRLDFASGTCDLSSYGRLCIGVSNTMDQAETIHLSVKGRVQQGQTPGGRVRLAPHAAGTIIVLLHNMPWVLDAPLKLEGMRGYPQARGGTTFDLRKTYSLHIFVNQDGREHGFSVSRITVDGAETPVKVLSAATFLPFVDAYGQFIHDDWPGKIHSAEELKRSKETEDVWLAAHADSPIADADRFGGWAKGPQLEATGYFRTAKVEGKWWLVDPDGHLFFSQGVDCVRHDNAVTGIGFREAYFRDLPPRDEAPWRGFYRTMSWPAAHGFYRETNHLPYVAFDFSGANLYRKYGADWRTISNLRAHQRIKAWGLNTIANWSDPAICRLGRTPYTLCLGTHGLPRLKDSTGWWGALPDPFDPAFERGLRERARKAAQSMKDDTWCVGVFVDNELSWNNEPRMAEVAERYFSTVSRVLKEELPHHLYLGCRIAWGTDVIYRAAARHCDVVSVNIYDYGPVKDLPPDAVDKPMINGEFHFGALDRGMFHTGLVATRNQADRAARYRDFVLACLDHPRYVGTHWFQWQDQALTGRSDGEDYQIGFLSVTDTPYPELVSAARDVAAVLYARRAGKKVR